MGTQRTLNGLMMSHLVSEAGLRKIFEACRKDLSERAGFWRLTQPLDQAKEPGLGLIRAQLTLNLRDAMPAGAEDKVAKVLGLEGDRLALWKEFHLLLEDNASFDAAQVSVIHGILRAIPHALLDLRTITCYDLLGWPGKPGGSALATTTSSVNIFAYDIKAIQENSFPEDVPPSASAAFGLVLAHEANHVVEARYVGADPALAARETALLKAAGKKKDNYLRSMFGDVFFQDAPQEFFASMSNEYFADSARTLRLGLVRFEKGTPEPLNQFLFFAHVYSLGGPHTLFYTMDGQGCITREEIPLTRDAKGRIDSLTVGGKTLKFSLDADGNVLKAPPPGEIGLAGPAAPR